VYSSRAQVTREAYLRDADGLQELSGPDIRFLDDCCNFGRAAARVSGARAGSTCVPPGGRHVSGMTPSTVAEHGG
jgi:hypothetical protein